MGAHKLSKKNTSNAPKFICPNCLLKPKEILMKKRLHWVSVVRGINDHIWKYYYCMNITEKKWEHSYIPLIWNIFVRIDSPSHSCPLWKIVSRIEALKKTAKLTLPSVVYRRPKYLAEAELFTIPHSVFGNLSFILNIGPTFFF